MGMYEMFSRYIVTLALLIVLLAIKDGHEIEGCKIIQNSKTVSVQEGGTMEMKYAVDLLSPFQPNWTLEIDVCESDTDRVVLKSVGQPEVHISNRSLMTIKEVGCGALSLSFKQEDCRISHSGTYRIQVLVNEGRRGTTKKIEKQCTIETVLDVKERSRSSQATTNEIRCVPKDEHVPTGSTLVSESLEDVIVPTVSTHRRFIETTKQSKTRFTDGKTSTSDGSLSVSTVNPYEGVMRRNNDVAETGVSSTLILVFALAVFSGILLIGLMLMAVMYSNRPRNRQTSEHIVRFTAGQPAPVDV
ncbi:uncharacterized protein [Ptychodera flava]|uniref:uncharacterized protein isoform X2 n=1 Tax=Ptychodera flava TaxID=63121 RepID=UPI003969ED83